MRTIGLNKVFFVMLLCSFVCGNGLFVNMDKVDLDNQKMSVKWLAQGFMANSKSRRYDRSLTEYILDEYFDKARQSRDQDPDSFDKEEWFNQDRLVQVITQRTDSIQDEILIYVGFDPNDQYAEKMKAEPVSYGLTLDAYKISQKGTRTVNK